MSHFLYKIYNISETQKEPVKNGTKQCSYKPLWCEKKQHCIITKTTTHFGCSENIPELYRCYYCDFKTDLLVEFNKHVTETKFKPVKKVAKTISSYVCDKCNFETYSGLVLLKHVYTKCLVNKSNATIMLMCLKSHQSSTNRIKLFCCRPSLLRKQPKTTQTNKLQPKNEQYQINQLQCDKCSFQTLWKNSLRTHKVRKHSTAPRKVSWFQCTQCLYRTKLKHSLTRHTRRKHATSDNIKWLECTECPYKSRWKVDLHKHQTIKHGLTWFQCEHCPHKTKWKRHLQRHVKEQHSEKFNWLLCEHCPYKAKQRVHMKLHTVQRHTPDEDIEWYKCEQCSYKAKIKASLKSHVLKRHTSSEDINWFLCEKCGYKAMERSHLRKHMLKKHNS